MQELLFVGNEDAGNNVAGLYSLSATCEGNGFNPLDYLSAFGVSSGEQIAGYRRRQGVKGNTPSAAISRDDGSKVTTRRHSSRAPLTTS